MDYPELVTDRLVLRIPPPSEVDAVVEFNAQNRDFLFSTNPALPVNFYSADFWTVQLQKNRDGYTARSSCRFFLFDGDRVVGAANLFNIVRGALQAGQLGYSLDREYEGKGYMSEALRAVIAHAFGPMDLHRLMADHLPSNHRSAILLARLGFQIEGYSKRYLRMGDGRWHDHVRTALVREDG